MTSKTIVESWYDENAEIEQHRLEDGKLEFEVTMRIVHECIATMALKHARVLDIGGGPGKYAIKLAKEGNRVTLNDLSKNCLAVARDNAALQSATLDNIIHANALDLIHHLSDTSFDVVLCLGPLYHLTQPEQRSLVIENAVRLTKPGGYILLAYVTIFAHLRDLARHDPERLGREWAFYESYLSTGEYTRRNNNESFHVYPNVVSEELSVFNSQICVERFISCEGFLGSDGGRFLAKLSQEQVDRWVDVVLMSANARETWNSADHLLVVMRKL